MNLFNKLLTALFVILLSIEGWGQVNLSTNLVAHYPLNGNANDATSTGYNGTITGATSTTDRFGNANSAYLFAGGNNIDMGNPPTGFGFRMGTGSFSFSVWFKPEGAQIARNGFLVGKRARQTCAPTDPVYSLIYHHTNQSLLVYWRFDDNNPYVTSTVDWPTKSSVAWNQWHHAVVVFDRAAGVRLYVDGVLANTRTTIVGKNGETLNAIPCSPGSPPTVRPGNFKLGNDELNNEYFNGKIDDVRFYTRVLTADDVYALYNNLDGIADCAWQPAGGGGGGTIGGGVITGTSTVAEKVWVGSRVINTGCNVTSPDRTPALVSRIGTFGTSPKGVTNSVTYGFKQGNDEYTFVLTSLTIHAYKNGVVQGETVHSYLNTNRYTVKLDTGSKVKLFVNDLPTPSLSITHNSSGDGYFFVEVKGVGTSMNSFLIRTGCPPQPIACAPTIYTEPKDKLDGGFVLLTDNFLRFKFMQEYASTTTGASVPYKIYDYMRVPIVSGNFNAITGTNWLALPLVGTTASKFYTLEFIGNKGEKYLVKFKTAP